MGRLTTAEVWTCQSRSILAPDSHQADVDRSREATHWKPGGSDEDVHGSRATCTRHQYNLVFGTNVKSPLAFNPSIISASEFRSWRDLLDPRWKGKIVMRDPRTAGPGLATATHLYTTEGLGKEYLDQLLASGVVMSTDDRQMLDWVAQGRYAIAIAPSELLTAELKDKGVPIELLPAEALREGSYLTAGVASIAVLDQAPHPNAVKVFLNWFLSREAQTAWSKAAGYTSRRLDVPRGHLPPFLIPKEGIPLQANYKEPYVMIKEELDGVLRIAVRP